MATQNEKVMELVKQELAKDPDITSGALFTRARKLHRSVRSLSLRQFHALYPLQVKRIQKAAAKRRSQESIPAVRKGSARPGRLPSAAAFPDASRQAIRTVLLEFAESVARAETKADMILVMGGLDSWVDRLEPTVR